MQITRKIVEILEQATGPLPAGSILEKLGEGVDSQTLASILNRLKRQEKIKAVKGLTGRQNWILASKSVILSPGKENGQAVELLKFLNDFFKDNTSVLFSDDKVVDFIIKNKPKFDEVEKICQV